MKTMNTTLYKYKSLGYHFFILDPKKNSFPISKAFVTQVCDETFSIGANGVIRGPFVLGNQFKMEVFDSSGIEIDATENSIRVFAKYLQDAGYTSESTATIITNKGKVLVTYMNEKKDFIKIHDITLYFPEDHLPMLQTFCNPWIQPILLDGRLYHGVHMEDQQTKTFMIEDVTSATTYAYTVNHSGSITEDSCFVSTDSNKTVEVRNYLAAACAYRFGLIDSKVTISSSMGELEIQMDTSHTLSTTAKAQKNGLLMMEYNHVGISANHQ